MHCVDFERKREVIEGVSITGTETRTMHVRMLIWNKLSPGRSNLIPTLRSGYNSPGPTCVTWFPQSLDHNFLICEMAIIFFVFSDMMCGNMLTKLKRNSS
jgi:hypothetical protein